MSGLETVGAALVFSTALVINLYLLEKANAKKLRC